MQPGCRQGERGWGHLNLACLTSSTSMSPWRLAVHLPTCPSARSAYSVSWEGRGHLCTLSLWAKVLIMAGTHSPLSVLPEWDTGQWILMGLCNWDVATNAAWPQGEQPLAGLLPLLLLEGLCHVCVTSSCGLAQAGKGKSSFVPQRVREPRRVGLGGRKMFCFLSLFAPFAPFAHSTWPPGGAFNCPMQQITRKQTFLGELPRTMGWGRTTGRYCQGKTVGGGLLSISASGGSGAVRSSWKSGCRNVASVNCPIPT